MGVFNVVPGRWISGKLNFKRTLNTRWYVSTFVASLGVEGDDETLDARDVDGLIDGTCDAFEMVEVCIPRCGG